jgi:hypothetical protein
MKSSTLAIVGMALFFAINAYAQDAPRVELFLEYSYLRFNPTLPAINTRSFNGGGGGLDFNLAKDFAIRAEFMGYGSTTFTTTFVSPVATSRGTIPAGTFSSSGNMFTYLFGPVIKYPTSKATFFGEVLFGGSNTNAYAGLSRRIIAGGGTIALQGTQHPFTLAVGGGFDINLSHHFAIRPADVSYLLTRYTNPLTSTNNQNNFRYAGGVVFKF